LVYTVAETTIGRKDIEVYKGNKDQVDLVNLDMIMSEISSGEAYDKWRYSETIQHE
jgi:hypothetical protein